MQTSAGKFEQTGAAEMEKVVSMSQSDQLARKPKPPLLKGKEAEPSVLIVRRERVKVSESRTLAREKGIKAGSWREKDGLHND